MLIPRCRSNPEQSFRMALMIVFNTQKSNTPNPPQAPVLSKAFRGFNHILDLWMTQIHAQCPDARLKAFIGRNELPSLKFNEQSF